MWSCAQCGVGSVSGHLVTGLRKYFKKIFQSNTRECCLLSSLFFTLRWISRPSTLLREYFTTTNHDINMKTVSYAVIITNIIMIMKILMIWFVFNLSTIVSPVCPPLLHHSPVHQRQSWQRGWTPRWCCPAESSTWAQLQCPGSGMDCENRIALW